jgi:uncharacterized membrane protein (DUF4010 family)
MEQQELVSFFLKFGLTAVIGVLIGLERSSGNAEDFKGQVRDFVIYALVGATSAFAAIEYANAWLIVAGFVGVLTLQVAGYWSEQRGKNPDPGVTTEAAALITFFLGVLIMKGASELAVAVAIVVLLVLSEKALIERFSSQIQRFELQAALKLLVISFIVLPVLPNQSLDNYVTSPIGTVAALDGTSGELRFVPGEDKQFAEGSQLYFYTEDSGEVGKFDITGSTDGSVAAQLVAGEGSLQALSAGTELRSPYVPRLLSVMLSALTPFQVWMIVVLVSFIGFIGYVLIKVIGAGAGIALTGLIGGLASSTVTTLSFSARSKELPSLNASFAVAVTLASAIMFPRVVLQIGVFNQPLMTSIALPMMVTGAAGLFMAGFFYWRSRGETVENQEIKLDNPFSLKSAVTFGAVFATILVATRVATAYLGDAWLPVVALVSGLTDADAIAFSVSNLQKSGLITLDWASFNLVLGALANTMMKLFLVFSLGDRGLFKKCLLSFSVMAAAGVITMLFYYDIG